MTLNYNLPRGRRSSPSRQNKNWIPRIVLVLAVALGLLTAPPPVAGADEYWDTSTNPGLQSGNGNWSTFTFDPNAFRWSTVITGSATLSVWTNGDSAFFETSGSSMITVAAPGMTVDSMTFDGNGYTIQDGGGSLSLVGTATITTNQAAEISAALGGSVGLTKFGSQTLTLSGANTYTGTTAINQGTLQLGNGGGTGSVSTGIVINPGANFTVNRNNTATQGTDFGNITGSGSLTQAGTGTTTLTAANTYTGATTVSAGTLLVNGSTVSQSAVTVNAGGTLGGSGTIGGTVTVLGGGNLSPGTSPGILSTGAVTMNAGSNFLIEINGTAVGTQYDQLNVTGTVTITGSVLVITVGGTLNYGDQFTIINNDSNDAVSGTFVQGNSVTSGTTTFSINYAGGDGNDIVLTVAPEPSTWIGGALAVAALAYLQRRRFAGLLKRKLA